MVTDNMRTTHHPKFPRFLSEYNIKLAGLVIKSTSAPTILMGGSCLLHPKTRFFTVDFFVVDHHYCCAHGYWCWLELSCYNIRCFEAESRTERLTWGLRRGDASDTETTITDSIAHVKRAAVFVILLLKTRGFRRGNSEIGATIRIL